MPIQMVCGFQVDETWTTANCSTAADTADYVFGSQSLKVTVNSGAVASLSMELDDTYDFIGNAGVWLKVDDLTKIDKITLYLDEDNTPTGYSCDLYENGDGQHNRLLLADGEWAQAFSSRFRFSTVGSPSDWGDGAASETLAVYRIRIEIDAVAGQAPVVHLGAVMTQRPDRAFVMFVYDDGHPSVLTTALPALAALDMRGTLTLPGSWIDGNMSAYYGSVAALTTAQVNTCYDTYLCDVSPHTWDHSATTITTTVVELLDQYLRCRKFCESKDWRRGLDFIHSANLNVDCVGNAAASTLAGVGFKGARGKTHRDTADAYPASNHRGNCWMPSDMFNFNYSEWSSAELSNCNTALTEAIYRREAIIFFTHDVKDSPTAGGLTAAEHLTFIESVATHRNNGLCYVGTAMDLWDLTWGERYGWLSRSVRP